jgi:hypothetical protein
VFTLPDSHPKLSIPCARIFWQVIAHCIPSMSDMSDPEAGAVAAAPDAAVLARKRPKPGERRIQILQTLAGMLEQPGA